MNTFKSFSWLLLLNVVAVTGCSHSPCQNQATVPNKDFSYSFSHAPFVSPRIIQDLSPWVSDCGDQVVAINLLESQDSNRYFGDALVRNIDGQNPFVYTQPVTIDNGETNHTEFGYQFVGVTSSGVLILVTSDWEGGTGVFRNLLLVTLEYDKSIRCDWDKGVVHSSGKRFLIKRVGEIALGDRWDGELKVNGNSIVVGKDNGWFVTSGAKGASWLADDRKDRVLKINLDH
jgi:hypothetical protein